MISKIKLYSFVLLYTGIWTSCTELVFVPHKDNEGRLSREFLLQLNTIFQPDVFIETGTCFGSTTAVAARIFPVVHTIELSPQLCQQARCGLAKYPHVIVHEGASESILPQLLNNHHFKKPLFFLDAHYSGSVTARSSGNTPIMQEIASIHAQAPTAIIIVDDLRLFQYHPAIEEMVRMHPEHDNILHYPPLPKLYEFIKALNSNYAVIVVGDALLVYRQDIYNTVQVSPMLQALTISRLCPVDETAPDILARTHAVEQTLLHPQGTESEALTYLCTNGNNWPALYGTYYYLWNALLALQKGERITALELLRTAHHNGMSTERLLPYLKGLLG